MSFSAQWISVYAKHIQVGYYSNISKAVKIICALFFTQSREGQPVRSFGMRLGTHILCHILVNVLNQTVNSTFYISLSNRSFEE